VTEVIKARPTTYKGVKMRSRLEADYAAWLDSTGLRSKYEPECFASGDGQWLPDFGSSLADDGPFTIFTEVKPVGPLTDWITGSVGWVEHADSVLRQMMVAWASRPDAALDLVFWHYGGPPHLRIYSNRAGEPWRVDSPGCSSLWMGMGQAEALCRAAVEARAASSAGEADQLLTVARRQSGQIISDARARADSLEREMQHRMDELRAFEVAYGDRVEKFMIDRITEFRAMRAVAPILKDDP
jgi:hypothetical protein